MRAVGGFLMEVRFVFFFLKRKKRSKDVGKDGSYLCVPAARMADTSLLLVEEGMRSTMYSQSSRGRRSPNGIGGGAGVRSSIIVVGPSVSAVALRGYREKVSSWLRAKMKSSFEFEFDDDDDGSGGG